MVFEGELLFPHSPQPIATLSTSSKPAIAAQADRRPLNFDGCLTGGCTGLTGCRSATNDCSSPSVVALVAELTRCRCSSIDSCPSASALSRTSQVAVRSLSLARVYRVATSTILKVPPASPQTRWRSWRRTRPRDTSVVARPTYSGHRATAATGGGLRASAAVPAGRGLLGTHRRLGGLRRQSLPAAGRQVPWQAQFGDVPHLPQGTAHVGVMGFRGPPWCGVGFGADRRGTGHAGHPLRRILRTRGGGMPHLQLEPSGEVVRARRGPSTKGIAYLTDRAQWCADGQ